MAVARGTSFPALFGRGDSKDGHGTAAEVSGERRRDVRAAANAARYRARQENTKSNYPTARLVPVVKA